VASGSSEDSAANQNPSVCWLIPDLTGDLTAEDGVLVPEHEQFGILGGVTV
jgi:hypothetical protein